MFDVLLASGIHHEVKARWVTTSLVAHGLVFALAVAATGAALDAPQAIPPDPAMLLFVPKPPPPAPPPEPRAEPAPARVVVAEPPPKGFQTIAAPSDIPDVIPPVDLTERPLDPRDFTGRGVEGGIADGVVGGSGVVDRGAPAGLDAIYEATTDDARFEQAVLVFQAAPRYPAHLASVGLEGRVQVEFVIDTIGKVEHASLRVSESTHPAFEPAALAALATAIFRPARLSNRPVRQLTRQAIRFVAAR